MDSQTPVSMPSMSRYRSQRRQAAKSPTSDTVQLPQPPPIPNDEQPKLSEGANVQRSRSRYRANRPVTAPSKTQNPSTKGQNPTQPAEPRQNMVKEEFQSGHAVQKPMLQTSNSSQNLRSYPERYNRPPGTAPLKSKSAHDLRARQVESQEKVVKAMKTLTTNQSKVESLAKAELPSQHKRMEAERQRQIALQNLAHNERSQNNNRIWKTSPVQVEGHSQGSGLVSTAAHQQMPTRHGIPVEEHERAEAEQQRMELERLEEAERLRWHKKREQERLNSKRAELLRVQQVSDMKQQTRKDALQNRQRAEQAENLRRQKFREMQREAAERSDALQKQQDARKAREKQTEKVKQAQAVDEAQEKEQRDRYGEYKRQQGEKHHDKTQQNARSKSQARRDGNIPSPVENPMPELPEDFQVAHKTQPEGTSAIGNVKDSRKDESTSNTRSRQDSSTTGPRPSTSREMFSFLKKKRSEESQSMAGKMLGRSRTTSTPKKSVDIRPGGAGIVPGIDAPISAVNAGERRVTVECGRSRRVFPVTPATTPVDLIRSASIVMSEQIDPKRSLLFEDFEKVGVRRPLRKYEHVRDVMNSWDEDSQNSLVLLPSTTDGNDPNLEAACVPVEQPGQLGLWLFYSNKPGKWEKRWVVMRQDGQVQHAKKEESPSKDFTNVCHLSDFDIYTPDPKSLTKKIRPPKKHCFAIKSQQKSNMFLTMDNFVHFFASADKNEASKWYDGIQGWRSWYLVHVLGEGKKTNIEDTLSPESQSASHQRNASNQSAYQLGSFQPLLDLDMFKEPPSDPQPSIRLAVKGPVSHTSSTNHRSQTSRGGGTHSSNFNNFSLEETQTLHNRVKSNDQSTLSGGSSGADDNMFAPSGLLGRSYSTRQKAQRDREVTARMEDGFVGGSSLLNHLNLSSSRNPVDGSGDTGLARNLSRKGSKHGPKPLIDITLTGDDSSTNIPKGKGYNPGHVGNGGLVESATTPEHAIDWRSRPQEQESRQSFDRSRSQHKRQMNSGGGSRNIEDNSLFVQDGLLANSRAGVGEGRLGRGIMDGSKATGPMIDVNQRSKFAMGSLLAKVERKLGPGSPVIDRTKQGEIIRTKTGEGL